MTATATTAVLDAARSYMELGWTAFPIRPIRADGKCECGGTDCAGKHPVTSGWPNTIASVTAVEALWARRHGQRGIGLACGPRVGIWGLDVDPRHGGTGSVRDLQAKHGPLPRTIVAHTGGGGWHLLFKWANGVGNSAGKIGDGIDVRGHGGYLVLPPSQHVTGLRYQWVFGPDTTELAEAPDWLLELARNASKNRLTQRLGAWQEQPPVPVGQRDHALTQFCGLLRAMGLYENTIVKCGHAFLDHQIEIDPAKPIDRAQAERHMRGICRRYPPHPNRESR